MTREWLTASACSAMGDVGSFSAEVAVKRLEQEIVKTARDPKLSPAQRRKKIRGLFDRLDEVQYARYSD